MTCEAAISETFHLLGVRGAPVLRALLRRGSVRITFDLASQIEPVMKLMEKYAGVPMSLADACLVRMTEVLSDAVILSTDSDFLVYRRHSRNVVPSRMPR
jgi:predicted nucleic acid-binding protein